MGKVRLEKRMRHHSNIDQQVARNPPPPTAPTMATDAQATAGRDTRGNVEAEMPSLPGDAAVALASHAFRSRHTLAAAVRASGRRDQEK